ncbi:carbohydrate porin [Blastopirellula sp. J2-11]|uniref:carbohydrate porin n=1 Tax=Blastopirellula sp. J2-11 TaxID=2943192 RepID=UPI0021C5A7CA|nr:carbohydrate porin [Blastopirellula sp. J2-11]UUO08311.1 carbohydrate porin [Blastopirellula sp. J2-11]
MQFPVRRFVAPLVTTALMMLGSGSPAAAQCDCADCSAAAAAPTAPNYAGCICERQALLGDWLGTRSCMLEHGMLWDIDQTEFFFGVASGGKEQRFTFAGHGDYVLNWDLGKAGIQEGMFVKLRAEHRYGESISAFDGSALPATIVTDLPSPGSNNVYLTDVLFTQFLSEEVAVFAGKLDALDGDTNAFASKRGKDQFSNLGFVVNPLLLRSVPYSTLGTGFILLRDSAPIFSFTILNPTNTSSTSGFEELFAEGVTINSEIRLPYEIGGYQGHQLFGGSWSSRQYTSLGQDPRVVLPDVPIEQTSGTWAFYWNMDQYLVHYDDEPTKGWGMFARASVADDQANPLASFFSVGIGGDSPICSRRQDTFGVGYYYLETSDQIGPFLQAVLGPIGDGHGVEMFYNYEVTPWFHLTTDMQILRPEVTDIDTALLVGLRGKISF